MATPHVTGAWAVMRQAKPTSSVSTVLALLKSTGVPIKDTRNRITKPRINVAYALGKSVRPAAAPVLLSPDTGQTWEDSTVELVWRQVFPADRYKVTVKQGTKTVINGLYKDAQACDAGGNCWIHVPTILKTGTFTWTVQAYSKAGPGPASLPDTFNTPVTVPGGITLTAPLGNIGYIAPSFTWTETSAPYAALYRLDLYKGARRIFSRSYQGYTVCFAHECKVTAPVKLAEADYSWTITPSNPVGVGSVPTGIFNMHFANGYSNHFDSTLEGMTTLYPVPGWWWLSSSNLTTWYGLNYTWATAKINATYGNIDFTAVMYRDGHPYTSNGIRINGVPTLYGRSKGWKTDYHV